MVEGSGFENRRARKGSRGSNPFSSVRTCGACGASLEGAAHDGAGGRTWVWRCACGWAAARTEPPSSPDSSAAFTIARALERMSPEAPVASGAGAGYGAGEHGEGADHE